MLFLILSGCGLPHILSPSGRGGEGGVYFVLAVPDVFCFQPDVFQKPSDHRKDRKFSSGFGLAGTC